MWVFLLPVVLEELCTCLSLAVAFLNDRLREKQEWACQPGMGLMGGSDTDRLRLTMQQNLELNEDELIQAFGAQRLN